MTASLRLFPDTALVSLNSLSDFAQRKAGFVLQSYVGWQSPCVLSEAWAARHDGQTPLALHGLDLIDILLFRLPNCKQTEVCLTASPLLLPWVFYRFFFFFSLLFCLFTTQRGEDTGYFVDIVKTCRLALHELLSK